LWPEVVYPLIERARWQRRFRSRTEALWDYLCARVFHLPGAGLELDRILNRDVPARVVAQLDDSVNLMVPRPPLEEEEEKEPAVDEAERLTVALNSSAVSLAELAAEESRQDQGLVELVDPTPIRFHQGQLHELWTEAIAAMKAQPAGPGIKPAGHRHVPVGPYRLVVVPSIRGRAAGQVAIQGMANKQIEMTTPPIRTKGSRPILAVWVYRDHSLVIAHLDFQNNERYILWHAPLSHQLQFGDPAELDRELSILGLEIPDQLDKALSRWFQPRKTV
jgi:serine/threonine-protein kinase